MERPKYHINVLWSQQDNCWLAHIPDVGGVMADGETPEEAVTQVLSVLDSVLESLRENNEPIPEPRYKPEMYDWLDEALEDMAKRALDDFETKLQRS